MSIDKNIVSAIDGKTYNKSNGKFSIHLREHGLTYQEYYEVYVTGKKEFCECGKPKKLRQADHVYSQTCGSRKCYGQLISELKQTWTEEKHQKVNAKRKQTVMEKYGVETVSLVEEFKAKTRKAEQTIVADGKTVKQLQQEKARATKLARYGSEFYNSPEAIKAGWAKMTDEKRNSVIENRRKTNLERYGTEVPLMRPEVIAKSAAKNGLAKTFVYPSGTEVAVQGYEPFALQVLLDQGYSESDIITGNITLTETKVPTFRYTNVNRTISVYYPDIFIPKENRIIEVKSQWWYDAGGREGYESRIVNNMRKKEAAIAAGFKFEFWVFKSQTSYKVL